MQCAMDEDGPAPAQGQAKQLKRAVTFDLPDPAGRVDLAGHDRDWERDRERGRVARANVCEWCLVSCDRLVPTDCIRRVVGPQSYAAIERMKFGHYGCLYSMALEGVGYARPDIKERLRVVLTHYNSGRPVAYAERGPPSALAAE